MFATRSARYEDGEVNRVKPSPIAVTAGINVQPEQTHSSCLSTLDSLGVQRPHGMRGNVMNVVLWYPDHVLALAPEQPPFKD